MADNSLFQDIKTSMEENRQKSESAIDNFPLEGFTPIDPADLGVEQYISDVVKQVQEVAANRLPAMPDEDEPEPLPVMEPVTVSQPAPPPVQLPNREPEQEPEEPHTAQDLDLMRAKYNEAVNREYYQMAQAGRLQNVAAVLLAAAGVTLSLCYSRSLPGYFEFYLAACLCPILLAITLAMTFADARVPRAGVEPLAAKGLTEEALYKIYNDLQEQIRFVNKQRAQAIRRNAFMLGFCVVVCIGFIITGVGIGA